MTKMLAFPVQEYRSRLLRLQEQLRVNDLAGLLVTTPENITYLSGFQTPGYYKFQGLIIPSEGEPVLVCRHLEAANVAFYAWIDNVIPVPDGVDPLRLTISGLSDLGLLGHRVGVELESWFLTNAQLQSLRELDPGTKFTAADGLVESLRVIKSPAEIEYIRTSCKQAVAGLQAGIAALAVNANELDVAAAVHQGCILAGAEYPSLPLFVLTGERTAIPHGTWGRRVIRRGDAVYFEIQGSTFRYTGARMHGAVVGRPTAAHRRAAEASIAGLEAAIAAIRPGVTSGEVDRACRDTIASYGFGPSQYRHRCGYGIGIAFAPDWGEGQIMDLHPGDPRELRAGMTFHMPPAIFHEDFALGFSESVAVTEDGCEVLTDFPRQLTIVD